MLLEIATNRNNFFFALGLISGKAYFSRLFRVVVLPLSKRFFDLPRPCACLEAYLFWPFGWNFNDV